MPNDITRNTIQNYYSKEFVYNKHDPKRINRWLKGFKRYSGKWLDIGCGRNAWYGNGKLQWFGIDLSQKALSSVRGNGECLPFEDNAFECVSMLGSVEHFDNPHCGIQEAFRVLKNRGCAVFVVPNYLGILETIGLYHGTEQPQELRLTKKAWKRVIENVGFIVTSIRRDYGPPVFKDKIAFKIMLRTLLKSTVILPDYFVYSWIFECRKRVDMKNPIYAPPPVLLKSNSGQPMGHVVSLRSPPFCAMCPFN